MSVKKKSKTEKNIKRTMKGSQKLYHDLFKLKQANMVKEIMIGNDKTLKDHVPHVHFYHSIDSSGRPQTDCSPIGGHTHKMTVTEDYKGNLTATCSGPLVRTKVKTKQGRTIEKILPSTDDNHTHEVEYIESSEFTVRKVNAEAVKAMSYFSSPDRPEDLVNGQQTENNQVREELHQEEIRESRDS